MSTVRTLVLRFYAYRAFVAEGFVYPVITIYALEQGLTLADIGLATGAFFLGTLVGEIPTGYIGDRVGRRNSLVIGAVAVSATHLGFAVADSVPVFVLVYAFWGVAATFRSGSADAWLYDVLAERDATERYTRVRGRAVSVFYVSAATTALAGGLLYELRPTFPFLAAAGITAVAAFVVASLPEPSVTEASEGFSLSEARDALRTVVANRQIRAFVLLSGAILAIPETIEVFVQPVAQTVGFRPATLGPLYAGLMIAAAGGSWVAPWVQHRLGVARWFTFSPVLLAGVLLVTIPRPVIAVPAFFVARSFNTATNTLGSTFLNDRIPSAGRATTLSGVSMVYALTFFVARATGGIIADATTPFVSMAIIGCLAVVVATSVRGLFDPFDGTEHPINPDDEAPVTT